MDTLRPGPLAQHRHLRDTPLKQGIDLFDRRLMCAHFAHEMPSSGTASSASRIVIGYPVDHAVERIHAVGWPPHRAAKRAAKADNALHPHAG